MTDETVVFFEDDWDDFINDIEDLSALHEKGNCPDDCIFCEQGEDETWDI